MEASTEYSVNQTYHQKPKDFNGQAGASLTWKPRLKNCLFSLWIYQFIKIIGT